MKKDIDNRKIKLPTAVFGVLIFLVFYLGLVAVLVYFFDSGNRLVRKTTEYIPYPVANWGTNFISVAKLKSNLNSVKMFYENQDFSDLGMRVDFATEDGKKRLKVKEKNILNKLIEDRLIENEVIKRGLEMHPEDISQEVSRKMQEYDSEEYLKNNLAKLYGWGLPEFEENIVKPDMYREKLANNIRETNSATILAKDKITEALKDLDSGNDFEEVARKYSEGESVKNGGDLGWFSATEMLPEIANVVSNLKSGERSDLIDSQLGFHIVLVEDRKTEDNVDKFKVKQIFVRTLNFSDWLFEHEKNANIHIFSRDVYWSREDGQVEFKNADLKNFEENLSKNSPGDISVSF